MSEITTIGLDLAKHVFQVHGIDAQGTTVLRKRLRRGQVLAFFSRIPRCVVGLEACATAHYWARELGALGHEVRLMPAWFRLLTPSFSKMLCKCTLTVLFSDVQLARDTFVAVSLAERSDNFLLARHQGLAQLVDGHGKFPWLER